MQNLKDVQLTAQALGKALPDSVKNAGPPPVGLILGTGLSDIVDHLDDKILLPFADIPGFPKSGVQSHAGSFVFGLANGLPVIIQQGRCHLYEGRSPAEVCMGVRAMGSLGIRTLIVTNAAGALNPLFSSGGLMLMSDMINHTGTSPLTGDNCDTWGERFPDMSCVFDEDLRDMAMQCALGLRIQLERGVYIGVHGPEMETPAETRMYRQWGADAIGMSTVLEVIAARHMGMKVMGISCLTNKNLPDCPCPSPLEEIINIAARAGQELARLLWKIFASLSAKSPHFAPENKQGKENL